MNVSFDKILIPVDFSFNSEIAIRKALALCETSGASIYMLHVFRDRRQDIQLAAEKLRGLKELALSIRSNIEVVERITTSGSVETAIIDTAKEIDPDLIIVCKSSHHSLLPFLSTIRTGRVAKLTGVPVLTVKPGSAGSQIRTVVVPVSEQFPDDKISILNALSRKHRIHIKLVFFRENERAHTGLPNSLLNAYRLLKNNPANNVSYDILKGSNKAKAILAYCNKVDADLLIVYPESETRIGWLNKQIADVLPAKSKTQILSVYPA